MIDSNKIESVTRYSEGLMTTPFTLHIAHRTKQTSVILPAISTAFFSARRVEQLMSPYIETSDVYRFNIAKVGEKVVVDSWTMSVVTKAIQMYKYTDGCFDITVKPLYDLWKKWEKNKEKINKKEIDKIKKQMGVENIIIDAKSRTLTKTKPNLEITLAGIAKGFAVDAMSTILRNYNFIGFSVSGGGDVVAEGTTHNKMPWTIGVEIPKTAVKYNSISLDVINLAAATSGREQRPIIIKGKEYNHILNPKTGYPVNECVGSSIFMPNCISADSMATALSVMGNGAVDFMKDKKMEGLIFTNDGNLFVTEQIRSFVKIN